MPKHKEWIRFAEDDLRVAEIIINSEYIVIGAVLFHAQQCAEKSLKAYLLFKKQMLRKTHDLVALVSLCMDLDAEFQELLKSAAELNPYLASGRYPDTRLVLPDTASAHFAIKEAKNFLDFVKNKI